MNDLFDTSTRERRSTFVKVVVGCLIAFILAPPLAQAAVQTIRGTVKIKDSGGGRINSSAVADMGLFDAAGSAGALDVRTFSGGGGFLGAGFCSGGQLPTTVTVNAPSIATGLIITGTANVVVSSAATDAVFGQTDFPILNFETTASDPTEVVAFGNGLTATAPLKLNCTSGTGSFAVIGQ